MFSKILLAILSIYLVFNYLIICIFLKIPGEVESGIRASSLTVIIIFYASLILILVIPFIIRLCVKNTKKGFILLVISIITGFIGFLLATTNALYKYSISTNPSIKDYWLGNAIGILGIANIFLLIFIWKFFLTINKSIKTQQIGDKNHRTSKESSTLH
jgi:hypothetical protein